MQFESLAFSVELFVIIFFFLCWLITPVQETVVVTEQENTKIERESQQIENISQYQEEPKINLPDTQVNAESTNETSISDTLSNLEIDEVRNIASLLQSQKILPDNIKFTGKGKTKVWIIKKIENILPSHQQDVEQALSTVLQREIA